MALRFLDNTIPTFPFVFLILPEAQISADRYSSMTLLGFVYLSREIYSYGRLKALGPPIWRPLFDVQIGCGAIIITVTFKPYLVTQSAFTANSMALNKLTCILVPQ